MDIYNFIKEITGNKYEQPNTVKYERPKDCQYNKHCLNGQYCDMDDRKCYEVKNLAYKEKCERNGGKFLQKFLYNVSIFIIWIYLINLFLFFLLDCNQNLKCIAKECNTMGEEHDFCSSQDHCR